MKEIAFADAAEMREAQYECQLMKEIKNRYVTQYIESFIKGKCLYMVMEYCAKGDLADYLSRCRI
jgi:serine/threonine protein kinase